MSYISDSPNDGSLGESEVCEYANAYAPLMQQCCGVRQRCRHWAPILQKEMGWAHEAKETLSPFTLGLNLC